MLNLKITLATAQFSCITVLSPFLAQVARYFLASDIGHLCVGHSSPSYVILWLTACIV